MMGSSFWQTTEGFQKAQHMPLAAANVHKRAHKYSYISVEQSKNKNMQEMVHIGLQIYTNYFPAKI